MKNFLNLTISNNRELFYIFCLFKRDYFFYDIIDVTGYTSNTLIKKINVKEGKNIIKV